MNASTDNTVAWNKEHKVVKLVDYLKSDIEGSVNLRTVSPAYVKNGHEVVDLEYLGTVFLSRVSDTIQEQNVMNLKKIQEILLVIAFFILLCGLLTAFTSDNFMKIPLFFAASTFFSLTAVFLGAFKSRTSQNK